MVQVPFHAYSEGNLNWLAAAEVESATSSMCLRVRASGACCYVGGEGGTHRCGVSLSL